MNVSFWYLLMMYICGFVIKLTEELIMKKSTLYLAIVALLATSACSTSKLTSSSDDDIYFDKTINTIIDNGYCNQFYIYSN